MQAISQSLSTGLRDALKLSDLFQMAEQVPQRLEMGFVGGSSLHVKDLRFACPTKIYALNGRRNKARTIRRTPLAPKLVML